MAASLILSTEPTSQYNASLKAIRELRDRGNLAFAAGSFEAAAQLYQHSYDVASRRGLPGESFKALNNLANIQLARYRYQDALDTSLKAGQLADLYGTSEERAIIRALLASTYALIGDLDSASKTAG